ncbi:MAG: NADP-dependent malic enzyme [Spirochaetales bacterium]|nr:NADP-dependent malic enzyme [Spirochaetales bacterium]
MDYNQESIRIHQELGGKIQIQGKIPLQTTEDLSLAYTPGVAGPCLAIAADPALGRELTIKKNSVAVVTDGSAVLGLGNIGPLAALPVMEGKALLFKELANIDAYPICLGTQDPAEIIRTVRNIAPGFGGINLEDIAAPHCFFIERELQDLGIPVFHDDQHGTAIVLLAALINACTLTSRRVSRLRIAINGAGAAGLAIASLLKSYAEESGDPGQGEIVLCDTRGAIHSARADLNAEKKAALSFTNPNDRQGSIQEIMEAMDVFIGVSQANLLSAADVRRMATDPLIFALANPVPEILPHIAEQGGVAIMATGRSDFPNQVNNALVFPGIFRGALDANKHQITTAMKLAAATALAGAVGQPSAGRILPSVLDRSVAQIVARAVARA